MSTDCVVVVSNENWNRNGGKMMKWIDNYISENCYKIKFGEFGQPVDIVFDTHTNAILFKLVLNDISTTRE